MTDHVPAERRDGASVPAPRYPGGTYAPAAESYGPDEIDLRDLWATLRRRRWTVFLTTAAVVGLVLAWTLWVTPIWYASALIRVDDEQPGLLSAPAALDALTGLGGGGSEIETELRILRTRPVAEQVVDELDLALRVEEPREIPRASLFREISLDRGTVEDELEIRRLADDRYRLQSVDDETPPLDVEFTVGEHVAIPGGSFVLADLGALSDETGDAPPSRIEITTVPFQEAVEDLMDEVTASRPDRDANVLQVGYRTTDRQLVHEVPNAMAESFIERRIDSRKTDARSTVRFLVDQVDATRGQLEAAEAELQGFREGEQIVAVEAEAVAQIERLAVLQTQRTQLAAERSALVELLSDIEGGDGRPDYRRLAAFPTFFDNQAVAGMLGSLIQADSAQAALLARMTPSHPDVIAIDERIDQLEGQLGSIGRNYVAALDDQIGSLDAVLDSFGAELESVPERQIRFARIQRQVEMLAELYTILQTRLKEAEVQEAIDDSSVRIVEYAIEPLKPVSPRPVRNLALAGALGLLLGTILAFLREYTDRRLHSSDRIEALFGLPTIARIPEKALANGRRGNAAPLVALEDAQSVGAESFRKLRTNVSFVGRGQSASQIVVTSPSSNEGKSATAANLAVALAQKGRRTLLVDADMRRPVQHAQFDVPQAPGLSESLVADERIEGVIRTTMLDTLDLLTAGRQAPNPAELLDSSAMGRLLEALRGEYDAVVIDAPPVLAVTDSSALAPKTDGVILVVRAGRTEKDAITLAIQQLRQVHAEILGVVVNDATAEGRYHSYYDDYHGNRTAGGLRDLIQRIQGVFS